MTGKKVIGFLKKITKSINHLCKRQWILTLFLSFLFRQAKRKMSRCPIENCPYYGTPDQDDKCNTSGAAFSLEEPKLSPSETAPSRCSHCSGRLFARRTTPLSEKEALEAMGWDAADVFPSPQEFEERMLFMRTTKQLPLVGADNSFSVQRAIEFIGLEPTKLLSVDMVLRVWNEVVRPRWLGGLAFQKALVRLTLVKWLLPKDDFGVGLCYFGRFGDGPTEARFVRNYISDRVSYTPPRVILPPCPSDGGEGGGGGGGGGRQVVVCVAEGTR